MFERWTPNARETLIYAQESADAEIGVDDLVYGVWRESDGLGARLLRDSGYAPPERARRDRPGPRQIPFTREAHDALRRAADEAEALGHRVVGTEHVLVALRPDLRAALLRLLEGK